MGQTRYKYDRSVDTGPVDYSSMDPALAKTIHEERIRRQIQSRVKMENQPKTTRGPGGYRRRIAP